jgi:MFS family permease
MTASLAPVAALLLSTALLLAGNGLQGTLVPVRASIEAFSTNSIGLMGTTYFFGFAAGCVLAPRMVRRAGHIRTFAAMAAIASAVALAHALILEPTVWSVFRGITGFCFAALYVVIESWLNERSTNENRGTILSIYNVINLTVITVGQMMLTLYDPAAFPLFALASILVSVAAVPLAMTASIPPAPVQIITLPLRKLYAETPVGMVGTVAVGLANGAFWTLGPVFAREIGLGVTGIALFMSITVLAGAAGQWPLGRLSDRIDRRLVIIFACVVGAAAGVGLDLLIQFGSRGILAFTVLYGAVTFPLYALCVAHTNDRMDPHEFVQASSALLLLYAGGAMVGPPMAAYLMSMVGPKGLFLFTAGTHAITAVFALSRLRLRAAMAPEDKEHFVAVPRTSATIYAIDPRAEEEDEESEERVAEDDGGDEPQAENEDAAPEVKP